MKGGIGMKTLGSILNFVRCNSVEIAILAAGAAFIIGIFVFANHDAEAVYENYKWYMKLVISGR